MPASDEHAKILRKAFDEYLMHLYEKPITPKEMLLSYDFDFINGRKWNTLADAMVRCDLRELTNIINRWNRLLGSWHAWNMVLDGREEMEAWDLRSEFLGSLVHECLLMPASIRDTITSVATAAFHQVRLSIDNSYRDHLEGDPKSPQEKQKLLNRRQKEDRLHRLIKFWPNSESFIKALRKINSQDYIEKTYNYRNLTTHSIGPRLGIGHTRTVKRSIENAQAPRELEDGTIVFEDIPGKLAVCYSFGGTPPLDIERVRLVNIEQYKLAYKCYTEYLALLTATVNGIESVEKS
ncbi:hypothetical protein [Rheinheimera sp.]|uniref:hypothetical protein n=1 Tax=Rheinheimera sp. TaxID=1869214 RepID=UPI002353B11E|nr:hypothetical protein [Rheinheimera sp.]